MALSEPSSRQVTISDDAFDVDADRPGASASPSVVFFNDDDVSQQDIPPVEVAGGGGRTAMGGEDNYDPTLSSSFQLPTQE